MKVVYKWIIDLDDEIYAYITHYENDNYYIGNSFTSEQDEIIASKAKLMTEEKYKVNFNGIKNELETNELYTKYNYKLLDYHYYYDLNIDDCVSLIGPTGPAGPTGPSGQIAENNEQYIYKLSVNQYDKPEKPLSLPNDDYTPPEGWSRFPNGISSNNDCEWACYSYKNKNNEWEPWSDVFLWSYYGSDGKNGSNGNNIEIRYAKTDSADIIPPLIRNDRNPGSNWGTIIPDKLGDEAIWGIQAYITSDNELCEDTEWQGPYLITGINGKTPTPLNYKTYVYKLSNTKPNPPVSDDPKNPGNGWVDYPNTSGQWWQCIGNVNGKTEKVEEWSEVLPVNGRDGVAQDGKFTEFRFAKSTNDNAPDLNKKERSPQGWEKEQPTIDINAGESLWMITAVINPDDTLVDEWSDPTRISGEKGPKGDTGPLGPEGPAGSQGVSGIPGKFIEPRYCLGTSDDYDAEAPVSNEREPNGWSTTLPDVTEDKPYIWFIQATIVFEDNDDKIGEVSGKWSTPSRLSGTNGLDGIPGADGRKGQIVYPAGIYSLDEAYTCDDDKSPYVLDTNDRQFYLLNTKMTWIGREQNDQYPSQVPDHWTKLESFEAIYAKVGIIANGLVGSVVFNDQYMFSQQGVNSTGGTSSDFENFDPDVPIGGEFTPNILFDMQKGTGHLAQGKIKFDGDKITTGSIIIGENAAFAYEHITSVNDGKITKLHCSIDNLSGDTDFVFDFYDDFTSNKNQIYDGVVINGSRKIVTIKNFVGICSNFNQLAKYNTDPSINIDTISLYPGTTLNYYFTPDEALGGVFMIGNVSDFQMVVQTDSDSGVYKLKSKGPNSIFDLSYIAAVKVLLGTSDSVSFTAYPKDMNVNVIYGSGSPHAQKRLVITIDGWKWGGRIHSLAMPYLYGSMSPEQRITFTEFESTEKSVGLFIDPIKDGVSLDNWMYYVIVYLFALPYDLY